MRPANTRTLLNGDKVRIVDAKRSITVRLLLDCILKGQNKPDLCAISNTHKKLTGRHTEVYRNVAFIQIKSKVAVRYITTERCRAIQLVNDMGSTAMRALEGLEVRLLAPSKAKTLAFFRSAHRKARDAASNKRSAKRTVKRHYSRSIATALALREAA